MACKCLERLIAALNDENSRVAVTVSIISSASSMVTSGIEDAAGLCDASRALTGVGPHCASRPLGCDAEKEEAASVQFTHEELTILNTVMRDRGGWPAVDRLVTKLARAVA